MTVTASSAPKTDGLLVPRTRDDFRYWLLRDLAAAGVGEWRAHYRVTQPALHYLRLRRCAEYARFGVDHPRPAGVGAALLAHRARRLGRRLDLDVPLGTVGPGVKLVGSPISVHPDMRLAADTTLTGPVVITPDAPSGIALPQATSISSSSNRRNTLTPSQVQQARALDASGRMTRTAIADAFWVSVPVLEHYLAGDPDRHHHPHAS